MAVLMGKRKRHLYPYWITANHPHDCCFILLMSFVYIIDKAYIADAGRIFICLDSLLKFAYEFGGEG